MNHRRLLASLVPVSFVLVFAAGCAEQPSGAPAVTTTVEKAAAPAADGAPPPAAASDASQPPIVDALPAADTSMSTSEKPSFTQAQLESMVAPIALYPDPLLMEILMAATYPLEVVAAAAWVKDHPGLNGKALDDAIAEKRWDVSVNSLTHAPKALELMAADIDWMQDLGDAFLAQQDDVLNAVQVMRVKACDLGNLKTNEQQKVVIEDRPAPTEPVSDYVVPPPAQIVRIEPAQPEVVYVPTYNPSVIYGAPPPVYYPQVYAYPPFVAVAAPVITFGVGLAIGGFLWGDCDWGYHRVYARPYYQHAYVGRWYWNGRYGGYNDFYHAGYAYDGYWRHDLDHRRGVRYSSYNVQNYYNVRGRDPYRYRDDNYRYDRHKASRGDYNRMPGFDRASRDARNTRDGFRDGGRDSFGDSRDGGRGDTRDWRDKARDDARQKMQRDSQTRDGGRGDSRDGSRDGSMDRGGRDSKGGDRDSARAPSMDRDGKGGGKDGDRGGKVDSRDGGKDSAANRGGSAKGPSVDRGGKGGSSGDRGGKADRPSGGREGASKADRPSSGGGKPSGDRGGSSMKGGGRDSGGSSMKGGSRDSGGSKGGSVQRGGSQGGSSQRGGSSMQRGGSRDSGSSKGGSVQRGGNQGGSSQRGGSSMQRGGSSGGGQHSIQKGGGSQGGSSQRGGSSGGGSQGGRSGGSNSGGGSKSGGKGGSDERGKSGGKN